jgi:DNA-binding beta-propeller fold protein YncE
MRALRFTGLHEAQYYEMARNPVPRADLMFTSAASFVLLALSAVSQQLPANGHARPNAPIPFDNFAGRLILFGVGPIHPFEFSADGSTLYAINQPGARLALLDPRSLSRTQDIPIGLGPVSVVARPGSSEVWVVDAVESCVAIVDPSIGAVVRTIRVGGEPYGLVFTPNADRAYVTCSGVDRVDVIDTATYTIAKSIHIPARNPRGIAYLNGKAYVVSFLSGNGTAPKGTPSDPDAVESIGVPGPPSSNPLPDQDLFVIPTQPNPAQDDVDPAGTVSGLGTILFNIHARPGTNELWIPNTDALNAEHKGEVNFVAGQVIKNRITIVDATGALPPRVIDLDAIAPADRKCAQPAYVEFDPVHPLAYVAGYGNDLVAVLRLDPSGTITWKGTVDLPASVTYPRGTGPRGVAIDPARTALYTFDRNDDAVSRIAMTSLPATAGWYVTAPKAIRVGFDMTSGFERLGRHLFTNARFSKSQTSSCASCHVDGHTDGLVWDLSHYLDPEGTPDDQLAFGTDVKGPMVTQSIRRMEDVGPFHWRGEIKSTNGFANTFVTLLENTVNGVPKPIGPEFQYLRRFMDLLAWPPNPREPLDRRYTGDQLAGANLFMTRPVQGSLTCASCHTLPSGSSGEIVLESAGGMTRSANVPALRGVSDKVSSRIVLGGDYGARSTLGAGLTHGGAIPSVKEAFFNSKPIGGGHHNFALSPQEAHQIEGFLSALDTGIAPCAAFMVTANADNWASVATHELPMLHDAAVHGHCDLVFHRVPAMIGTQVVNRSGLYDPLSANYRVASASAGRMEEQALLAEAASGSPVTFIGVPIGMGESQALDRDVDGLFDLDEVAAQTDMEDSDTDGDGFADGYEIAHGSDPLQPNASVNDTVAPVLVGPVRLLHATTNVLRFEFETSEFCRVYVAYNGGPVVTRVPFNQAGDHHHWVVLNELESDTDYNIDLTMVDAAGNTSVDTTTHFHTAPRVTVVPAHVSAMQLSIQIGGPGHQLQSVVALAAGRGSAGAGYSITGAVYQSAFDGSLHMVSSGTSVLTQPDGTATFVVDLPTQDPSPGTLYFVVQDVTAPPAAVDYAVGLNTSTLATITY